VVERWGGRGSNFGNGGSSDRSFKLIGTEEVVAFGLKRNNSEFFESELAEAAEAA
jgi:hypothetical protein